MKYETFKRRPWLTASVTVVFFVLLYLLLWPVKLNPVAWKPSPNAGYTGAHQPNTKLSKLSLVGLQKDQIGPEFFVAHNGYIYTGLLNGDLVRMEADGKNQTIVTNTGGRPLGLHVDSQGRLLVADAMKGLLRVQRDGSSFRVDSLVDPLINEIGHADAVVEAPDGVLWFTDASTRFHSLDYGTFVASVLDILEHSCTGRIMSFNPKTKISRVAMDGLCFPNGLQLSEDGRALLISEMGAFRVLRVDLNKLKISSGPALATEDGLQKGSVKLILDNLPGYPDNLSKGADGRLWIGLTKPRSRVVDAIAPYPLVRKMLIRLPLALWPVPKPYGHIIAFNEEGKILDDLQDPSGAYPETSGAIEVDGKLYVQSLHAHAIGWMPYEGPGK